MKFTEPHQFEANDPNSRKRRLETQLAAWRVPRFEYWARPAVPPRNTELTADELHLWFDILRTAEPVPPRTHRTGFDIYARLFDLPVDDLVRDDAVRIVGDRVALSSKVTGLPPRMHDWSLLVPKRIGEQFTEVVLRKRFQDVQSFGDTWLAAGTWFNCTDSICVLTQEALTAATPESLLRVWQLSLALYLEYRFLPVLPSQPAERLATKLGQELLAAADQLGLETDAELLRFAMGREDGPRIMPLALPASRLAGLLESEGFLEYARYRPGDSYHDATASALARVSPDAFAVGDVLLKLRPGSALLCALDSIALDRPEFVADYAFHQSFAAEGAFLLLQLAQRGHLAQANQIDFRQEWLQVQQLGRQLLLLNSQAIDWDSLVTLGIHDESQAVNRRHYGVAPIDRDKAPYDGEALWKDALRDTACALHVVEALERYFNAPGPKSDASILFALRLLGQLEAGDRELALRLATTIVDAYVAGLLLDGPRFSTLLPAYGEQLAQLHDVLDLHGRAWRRLLRPFDVDTYLQRALDDQSNTTRSTNSASFNVPQIVRAHAEALTALAGALHEGFEEVLHAALELYNADGASALNVRAFSWNALARITFTGLRSAGEPLFLTIGRLLRGVKAEPRWLEEFLRDAKEAHILGWTLAGLGSEHALYIKFRPQLLALLDALIGPDHGIALGHAMELAHILQQAAMPEHSERFARYALTILEERRNRVTRDQFSLTAQALLAVALAQQEKWSELLDFESDRNAIVLSPHARIVENMRAVALLSTGKPQEAQDALKRLLDVEPGNGMALANLVAIPMRAEKWPETIEAARRAREQLSGELLDDVLLYEAHAREQLKDTVGAASALAGLSKAAAERKDVRAAQERLVSGESTVVPVTPAIVAAGTLAPDESVDIAIVTALLEEYDAVRERLTEARFAPTGEGRAANFHGWQLGTIAKRDGSGRFRVVLATTGRTGNLDSFEAITRTIERFSPRALLFCGIAGGLKHEGLAQGDIVLAETIWFYPYGKIVDGTYDARHRDYPTHQGLLTQGRIFGRTDGSWRDCGVPAPSPDHVPKCLPGLIGSGDMVIDDLTYPLVQSILKARPKVQAIEMEAAGAGAAVQKAHELQRPVAFMMVRGISDMPKDHRDAPGAGTEERDAWKKYASVIAAHFAVSWIASEAWPFQPKPVATDSQQEPDANRLPRSPR